MLDIYNLQVFLTAAETENFSEAGRRLNLSQPSVSTHIRSLEQYLDVELFERAGRHIGLTEAGQALVPLAQSLVSHAIQVEEAVASLHGEVMGMLKVGCSTTVGKYVLPKLMARLCEEHPQVQATCHVTSRNRALEMLLEGQVHVAVTSLREPHKDLDYRPFLTDRIVLVVPPNHPWALNGRTIRPEDLLTEKFILREESSGTRASLKDGLAWHDLGLDDLNTVMTLGNSEAICMAVQERIGVAFVSCMVAAEAIRMGALVAVDVAGLDMHKTVFMAYHTGRPATRAQSAFWELAFASDTEPVRRLPEQALGLEVVGKVD